MNRRQLLQGLSGLFFADCLLPHLSFAQAAGPKRKFVFAYFEGGWDLLLGLDPRDPSKTNTQAHLITPGYDQLGAYAARGIRKVGNLSFGPAVSPSFLQVASECSVINGIIMDTAAHEVGRRYFITGRFPRGLDAVGSSTGAEILAQVGEGSQIPHLSAGVESFATGVPSFASALNVNSLQDILTALSPIVSADPMLKAALEAYQDSGPGCEGVRSDRDGLTRKLGDSVTRSRDYVKSQLYKVFDLGRTDAEMQALFNLYDLSAAQGDLGAPEVLAFIAAQAIKKSVSQCVSVRVGTDLDTHANWAQDQAPRQERGWKALASLLADLKSTPGSAGSAPGKTMLDETTVMVFSEFGRTPLFNNIRGRDHFLGNSALIAGAGIKRGLTVGKSADVGMMPSLTELATGQGLDSPTEAQKASAAFAVLTPRHVLATVLKSAGLNTDYLRAEAITALLP